MLTNNICKKWHTHQKISSSDQSLRGEESLVSRTKIRPWSDHTHLFPNLSLAAFKISRFLRVRFSHKKIPPFASLGLAFELCNLFVTELHYNWCYSDRSACRVVIQAQSMYTNNIGVSNIYKAHFFADHNPHGTFYVDRSGLLDTLKQKRVEFPLLFEIVQLIF